MKIVDLYMHIENMTKFDIIKVIDVELHVVYYGQYKRIPDYLLNYPIDGYRYLWGEYIIWLA